MRHFGLYRLAWQCLLLSCVVCSTCTIRPYAGPFSCADGEACPPGEQCGADDICHTPEADGGRPISPNEAGVDAGTDAEVDGGKDPRFAECQSDEGRCVANTPQSCVDGGWVSKAACRGDAPACSNGVCGAVKVAAGSLTVSGVSEAADIKLVESGLEYTPLQCSGGICFAGGIVP